MKRSGFLIIFPFIGTAALADTISISSNITTVAQSGSANFTVSVSPGTYVQSVLLSYEGEANSDQATSSPYSFTHLFNNPKLGLLVTATVKYSNGDTDGFATTTINVVGLTISGSGSVTRGFPTTYTVQSNPTGVALSNVSFTYTSSATPGGTTYDATFFDANSAGDDKSSWLGMMIATGTMSCSATVMGVTPSATKTVTVNPRNWTTPITCVEDNETNWGDEPTATADLGQNRDRDSNAKEYIFVPRYGAMDFTPAMTFAQLTSGPCAGWWYLSATSLKCQRETVINKYIKSTGPALGGVTFQQANSSRNCLTGDFVTAVMHHEYRGTPSTARSWEGHQGRIEFVIQQYTPDDDAKKHIEGLMARSLADLKDAVNTTILQDESDVFYYESNEDDMLTYGPNWGADPDALGYGLHSAWTGSGWTDCVNGPSDF